MALLSTGPNSVGISCDSSLPKIHESAREPLTGAMQDTKYLIMSLLLEALSRISETALRL